MRLPSRIMSLFAGEGVVVDEPAKGSSSPAFVDTLSAERAWVVVRTPFPLLQEIGVGSERETEPKRKVVQSFSVR